MLDVNAPYKCVKIDNKKKKSKIMLTFPSKILKKLQLINLKIINKEN
mgnify:CR=1 FL=1